MTDKSAIIVNRQAVFIKWVLATVLGWSLSLLPTGGFSVRTQADVNSLLLSYLVNGLIIGVICGMGQGLVLGLQGRGLWKWTFITGACYAIGLPIFIQVAFSFAVSTWPTALPALSATSSTSILLNLVTASFAGAVFGLGQWPLMVGRFVHSSSRRCLLWILSNVCGLGMGASLATILVSLAGPNSSWLALNQILARAVVGLTLGVVSGAGLMILLRPASGQQSARKTAMAHR